MRLHLRIRRRREDVAALALNRLYEDRRDALGVDLLREQLVLEDRDAAHRARGLTATVVAAVAVAVRDVMHLGQKRREPGALHRLARGEAQPAVGATVERAQERDQRRATLRMADQLDRALHCLGPGVRQEHALLARPRRELGEPLAQRGEALEVEVAAADVEEPPGGFLNRADHRRVAVTRRR